jgi:hypothetical protein
MESAYTKAMHKRSKKGFLIFMIRESKSDDVPMLDRTLP